jgi:ferredoxin-NADP reductase
MAELRDGTVVAWRQLSPILAVFRLAPAMGSAFPDYKPGQYIALRREDCRLTRRVQGPDGQAHYVPILDENGQQKIGPVTHSYSISSAPYETREGGHLEFYVVLEKDADGHTGRLTGSLFQASMKHDDRVGYVNRIVGDFTLDKRAAGVGHVLFVATGTGLAPFVSMLKELAREGSRERRYTLLHTNRTREELGYHEELVALEASGALDLLYIPTVSRPTPRDLEDPSLGSGRANNVLRSLFGMPSSEDASRALVKPSLPARLLAERVLARLPVKDSVILTCGNPSLMADVKTVADAQGIRFEKEDW